MAAASEASTDDNDANNDDNNNLANAIFELEKALSCPTCGKLATLETHAECGGEQCTSCWLGTCCPLCRTNHVPPTQRWTLQDVFAANTKRVESNTAAAVASVDPLQFLQVLREYHKERLQDAHSKHTSNQHQQQNTSPRHVRKEDKNKTLSISAIGPLTSTNKNKTTTGTAAPPIVCMEHREDERFAARNTFGGMAFYGGDTAGGMKGRVGRRRVVQRRQQQEHQPHPPFSPEVEKGQQQQSTMPQHDQSMFDFHSQSSMPASSSSTQGVDAVSSQQSTTTINDSSASMRSRMLTDCVVLADAAFHHYRKNELTPRHKDGGIRFKQQHRQVKEAHCEKERQGESSISHASSAAGARDSRHQQKKDSSVIAAAAAATKQNNIMSLCAEMSEVQQQQEQTEKEQLETCHDANQQGESTSSSACSQARTRVHNSLEQKESSTAVGEPAALSKDDSMMTSAGSQDYESRSQQRRRPYAAPGMDEHTPEQTERQQQRDSKADPMEQVVSDHPDMSFPKTTDLVGIVDGLDHKVETALTGGRLSTTTNRRVTILHAPTLPAPPPLPPPSLIGKNFTKPSNVRYRSITPASTSRKRPKVAWPVREAPQQGSTSIDEHAGFEDSAASAIDYTSPALVCGSETTALHKGSCGFVTPSTRTPANRQCESQGSFHSQQSIASHDLPSSDDFRRLLPSSQGSHPSRGESENTEDSPQTRQTSQHHVDAGPDSQTGKKQRSPLQTDLQSTTASSRKEDLVDCGDSLLDRPHKTEASISIHDSQETCMESQELRNTCDVGGVLHKCQGHMKNGLRPADLMNRGRPAEPLCNSDRAPRNVLDRRADKDTTEAQESLVHSQSSLDSNLLPSSMDFRRLMPPPSISRSLSGRSESETIHESPRAQHSGPSSIPSLDVPARKDKRGPRNGKTTRSPVNDSARRHNKDSSVVMEDDAPTDCNYCNESTVKVPLDSDALRVEQNERCAPSCADPQQTLQSPHEVPSKSSMQCYLADPGKVSSPPSKRTGRSSSEQDFSQVDGEFCQDSQPPVKEVVVSGTSNRRHGVKENEPSGLQTCHGSQEIIESQYSDDLSLSSHQIPSTQDFERVLGRQHSQGRMPISNACTVDRRGTSFSFSAADAFTTATRRAEEEQRFTRNDDLRIADASTDGEVDDSVERDDRRMSSDTQHTHISSRLDPSRAGSRDSIGDDHKRKPQGQQDQSSTGGGATDLHQHQDSNPEHLAESSLFSLSSHNIPSVCDFGALFPTPPQHLYSEPRRAAQSSQWSVSSHCLPDTCDFETLLSATRQSPVLHSATDRNVASLTSPSMPKLRIVADTEFETQPSYSGFVHSSNFDLLKNNALRSIHKVSRLPIFCSTSGYQRKSVPPDTGVLQGSRSGSGCC